VGAAGLPTLFGAGDLLAARVLELDRRPRLAGGRLDFEPEDATELMAALAQAHDGYLEDFPGSGWEGVLREHLDLFPAFLAHKAREPEASLTLADEFVDPFADLA
jgi:hypothetical protein